MPLPISDFTTSNGVRVLPAIYANGLAAVSGFDVDSSLIIPLSPPLASGYNAIGEFFIVSNDGDSTAKPNLTLSVKNFQIIDLQTGTVSPNITLAFGEGVIIGMESGGAKQVTAIRLVKPSSGPGYTLPPATATVLGGIKAGNGITVQADGTISVTEYSLPTASDTVLGGVKVGTGLTIGAGGVLSVVAGTPLNVSGVLNNPVANTVQQVISLPLTKGKWLISASQLTAATGTIPVGTGIKSKVSLTASDMTDDAYVMSASVVQLGGGGGRFGATVPTKILDVATTATAYLNYQTTNALTGTIFGQLTAIKLS